MKIPYYQINSFTSKDFTGNPAGVCLLETWLSDEQMQHIATENNLSETAFVVKKHSGYHIRWFTPAVEVDLCGHATLAAGHAILEYTDETAKSLSFDSLSGILNVKQEGNFYILDFPADELHEVTSESSFTDAFPLQAQEIYKGATDYLLVFGNESEIRSMNPRMELLASLKERGVIVTAPGDGVDFVSRFFAPQSGIPEDPVTGSAHTSLAPYWSNRLSKTDLTAWQLSKRGGLVHCSILGDRVLIKGQVTLYISGYIFI